MSDYIVYKKVPCTHAGDESFDDCFVCIRQEYDLIETDLEDAIVDLVRTSARTRVIFNTRKVV